MKKHLALIVTIAAGVIALGGCSASEPKATPQQEAQFSGRPMPPELRQKMMESQAAEMNKIQNRRPSAPNGQ